MSDADTIVRGVMIVVTRRGTSEEGFDGNRQKNTTTFATKRPSEKGVLVQK